MGLENFAKSVGQYVIAPVTLVVAMWTGFNLYSHQNVRYVDENGKKMFQKIDGPFNYTEVKIDTDGSIEINKNHSHYKSYTDKNGDGLVDRLGDGGNLLVRGSHFRYLCREEHFGKYTKEFQLADAEFKKEMERFKQLINK